MNDPTTSLYGFPVLRYGTLCQISSEDEPQAKVFSLEDALTIRKALKTQWGDISSFQRNLFEKNGLKYREYRRTDKQEMCEGPVINFPITCSENSLTLEGRISVTVCLPPKRSKIWSRILLRQSKQYGELLPSSEIEKFYNISKEFCLSINNYMFSVYKNVFAEMKPKVKIEPVHFVTIETTGSKNPHIHKFLDDIRERRVTNIYVALKDQQIFESLKFYLSRILHRDISSAEQYKEIVSQNDDFSWTNLLLSNGLVLYSEDYIRDKHFTEFNGIAPLNGSGRPTKPTEEVITRTGGSSLISIFSPFI